MDILEEVILYLLGIDKNLLNIDFLKQVKRQFSKKYKLENIISNIQLLRAYNNLIKKKHISANKDIEILLRKRAIRSQSGIVSVQVLTKPFWCPGECIFCPNDPTMPKSYIKTEPGAMRALLNQFDPYRQTYNRLLSLRLSGHNTEKIEMIVLGGTRDVYPKDYKIEFIKGLYDACNNFSFFFENVEIPDGIATRSLEKGVSDNLETSKFSFKVKNMEQIKYPDSIEKSIKINETSNNRIIGLTIETRPEYVTDDNCLFWRDLGVTRLEIGLQSTDDEVLRLNKRGHNLETMRQALHKLRQYGFKISIHMMPGLYGSNVSKDIKSMVQIYSDIYLKPDEIKFYPTSVIPNTELYDLYKAGKYKPLDTDTIKAIIKKVLLDIIPPYTRIKRLIRDIPSTEIAAGSNVTNLSQLTREEISKTYNLSILQQLYKRLYGEYEILNDIDNFYEKIKKNTYTNIQEENNTNIQTYIIGNMPNLQKIRNYVCLDTRSREIRNRFYKKNNTPHKDNSEFVNLVVRQYDSSVGKEFFISFEDELGYLYGFTRLLLPEKNMYIEIDGLGKNTSIIRELHIYGNVETINKNGVLDNLNNIDSKNKTQHKGFGKQLLIISEKISKIFLYKKISVISGVGVREYYQKNGYSIEGTYMIKNLF